MYTYQSTIKVGEASAAWNKNLLLALSPPARVSVWFKNVLMVHLTGLRVQTRREGTWTGQGRAGPGRVAAA